nr:MAG TPA: hypothetical protein [Caudoviricetes sp.]
MDNLDKTLSSAKDKRLIMFSALVRSQVYKGIFC